MRERAALGSAETDELAEPLEILVIDGASSARNLPEDQAGENTSCIRVTQLSRGIEVLSSRMVDLVLARAPDSHRGVVELLNQVRTQRPQIPVILYARAPEPSLVVTAVRHGATDFLAEDIDAGSLREKLAAFADQPGIAPVFASDLTRCCFELAGRVAGTDVSVLISGESGTGKEVIARFIHERSGRRDGPFVAVNCAAIPEQMMEATLFGHEKGAYTGAHQARSGKFELAESGTLLLDEISEMGLELQAKLLRVLQEREVERIGAKSSRNINVRVLATSNRELQREVREGRFREDLYYRLSVFPLHVPALRERVEDIQPLISWFLRKHGPQIGRTNARLAPESVAVLERYPWPGNVRELENAVQRALVLAEHDCLQPDDFRLEGLAAVPAVAPSGEAATDLAARVQDTEQSLIQEALASCSGRRRDAARLLGISERTLRHKLQRLREKELRESELGESESTDGSSTDCGRPGMKKREVVAS